MVFTDEIDIIGDLASTSRLKVWERGQDFLTVDKQGLKRYFRAMAKATVSDYFRGQKKEGLPPMLEKDVRETVIPNTCIREHLYIKI